MDDPISNLKVHFCGKKKHTQLRKFPSSSIYNDSRRSRDLVPQTYASFNIELYMLYRNLKLFLLSILSFLINQSIIIRSRIFTLQSYMQLSISNYIL